VRATFSGVVPAQAGTRFAVARVRATFSGVVPAQAGTQRLSVATTLGRRLRGDDEVRT